jgi:hypothetical protein
MEDGVAQNLTLMDSLAGVLHQISLVHSPGDECVRGLMASFSVTLVLNCM